MTTRSPLRAILAEDEPLARQALRRLLEASGEVKIAAEVEDVPALRSALHQHAADVLFLDIAMPGGSGLDVVPLLPPDLLLVFTTAHAEHAARAFAHDAVDYLVKPFGTARVRDAIHRLRRRQAAMAPDASPSAPSDVLLIRIGTQLHPVPVASIWRLEAADDCVAVITATRRWLHGETLGTLLSHLDPAGFLRVHRRHAINLNHVSRVEPADERRLCAVFPDESRVVCSRTGTVALRDRGRTPGR